jgi:hypothetical protein
MRVILSAMTVKRINLNQRIDSSRVEWELPGPQLPNRSPRGFDLHKSRQSDWCVPTVKALELATHPSLSSRGPLTITMAKGAASKDKKSAEKKSGDKGKGKAEDSADKGGGKVLAWLD